MRTWYRSVRFNICTSLLFALIFPLIANIIELILFVSPNRKDENDQLALTVEFNKEKQGTMNIRHRRSILHFSHVIFSNA